MVKLFYAGDSTVTHNKIDSYPQTGLSQGIQRYLKDSVWVRPFGFNGRSTKSFIEEGHLEELEAEMQAGDFLLIEFGHNDEKEDPGRHAAAFGSYQENLKRMADAAKACGAYPVLITPLARRLFSEDGHFLPGSHGEYPAAVKALAAREQLPVVDLCDITERYLAQVGDMPSRDWFMWPKDNTHLKPQGAVLFAGFLCEALEALGEPYAQLFCSRKEVVENVGLDVS